MVSNLDENILQLLSGDNLSAKQIFFSLTKNDNFSISYQAIHKKLKSMIDEGILEKKENKYLINLFWVRQQKTKLSLIEESINSGVQSFDQNLIFNSITEVDKFLLDICQLFNPKEKSEIVLNWIHPWIPLFLDKEIYKKLKNMISKYNFYCTFPSKTIVDKWCANFWKKNGVKVKIGVDRNSIGSILVFNDYIIQVFYPDELIKKMDKFYSKCLSIKDLEIDEFFEVIFEYKTQIPVLISKNNNVAKQLSSQIKKDFN